MRKIYLIITFLVVIFLVTPISGLLQSSQNIPSQGIVKDSSEQRVLLAIKVDNLAPLTEEQLRHLAKYDLLITYASVWNKAQIEKLRQLNPEMRIFGYRNVAFIDERVTEEIERARANGWILRDGAGNEVYEKKYTFLKLVDVGNPAYQEWVSGWIKYRMTDLVMTDGVFGDNTHLIDPYVVSARPINPKTGELYKDEEWRDGTLALAKLVKEKTGLSYIVNGAGMDCGAWDTGYWKNKELAEPLINEVDGVLLEGLIRWANEDWRSEEVWKKDLEFLDYLNKKGKLTIAWTITYGTLPQGATKYQVAMYGFATYLMAKSGTNAYFCARDYEEKFYNVSKINVGYPLEEYHIRGDVPVYEREFSNVLVLLNPSDNNFTLRLGRNFTTLDGETVSEISLPAKSGIILLKYG